jgi:hypothetical protein
MKTVYTIVLGTLLAVTLACGYSSKNYSSGASNMPAISQLNPGSVNAGDAAFTLTVNGSNFASKAVVNWNVTAQTTTYMTNGQLTIAVPAAAVATAATIQISVTNPAISGNGMYGGSPAQTSQAMAFMIH